MKDETLVRQWQRVQFQLKIKELKGNGQRMGLECVSGYNLRHICIMRQVLEIVGSGSV